MKKLIVCISISLTCLAATPEKVSFRQRALMGIKYCISRFAAVVKIMPRPYMIGLKELNQSYLDKTNRIMNYTWMREHYIRAKNQRDPHYQFLRKSGMKFIDGDFHAGGLYQFLETYYKKIRKHIDAGTITWDDVIHPSQIYIPEGAFVEPNKRLKLEDFVYVKMREEPPKGHLPYRVKLLREVIWDMIAKGYHPFGELYGLSGEFTIVHHDLAHFSAYAENPDYMKYTKKLIQRIVEDGGLSYVYQDHNETYIPWYDFHELVTLVMPEKREKLEKILGLPLILQKQEFLQKTELTKFLESFKNSKNLRRYIQNIVDNYETTVERIGPVMRDIILRQEIHMSNEKTPLTRTPDYFWIQTRRLLKEYENTNKILRPIKRAKLKTELIDTTARFIVYLDGISKITLDDWYNSFGRGGALIYDSPIVDLMQNTGIFDEMSTHWKVYIPSTHGE